MSQLVGLGSDIQITNAVFRSKENGMSVVEVILATRTTDTPHCLLPSTMAHGVSSTSDRPASALMLEATSRDKKNLWPNRVKTTRVLDEAYLNMDILFA
jgi:hypothetical protein